MIILGIALIAAGLLVPALHVLFILGVILLVVGIALLALGGMGRPVAGRRHFY